LARSLWNFVEEVAEIAWAFIQMSAPKISRRKLLYLHLTLQPQVRCCRGVPPFLYQFFNGRYRAAPRPYSRTHAEKNSSVNDLGVPLQAFDEHIYHTLGINTIGGRRHCSRLTPLAFLPRHWSHSPRTIAAIDGQQYSAIAHHPGRLVAGIPPVGHMTFTRPSAAARKAAGATRKTVTTSRQRVETLGQVSST